MKRYVRYIQAAKFDMADPSLFEGTPFTYKKVSGYEDYLNSDEVAYYRDSKNRVGNIVMMTPMEYFQACAKLFNTSVEALIEQRSDPSTVQYEEDMRNGDKFPLCYVDYTKGQEGLHRMLAAGNVYGWDKKFPVLVVDVYDQAVEDMNNAYYNYGRFLKFGIFDEICRKALDNYVDVGAELPADFEKSFRNAVISAADKYEDGYDIDVAVEVKEEDDGEHNAYVYITRYEVYEIPQDDLADPYIVGLDYLYDFGEDTYKPEPNWVDDLSADAIDEAIANGVDLNDYDDIVDFFFRKG